MFSTLPTILDPKTLVERKLSTNWSSPELAQVLEARPSLLTDIGGVFRGLEHALKVR
jgi:hypothetical protein